MEGGEKMALRKKSDWLVPNRWLVPKWFAFVGGALGLVVGALLGAGLGGLRAVLPGLLIGALVGAVGGGAVGLIMEWAHSIGLI